MFFLSATLWKVVLLCFRWQASYLACHVHVVDYVGLHCVQFRLLYNCSETGCDWQPDYQVFNNHLHLVHSYILNIYPCACLLCAVWINDSSVTSDMYSTLVLYNRKTLRFSISNFFIIFHYCIAKTWQKLQNNRSPWHVTREILERTRYKLHKDHSLNNIKMRMDYMGMENLQNDICNNICFYSFKIFILI